MKKILIILLVLSLAFFLFFFFEKQGSMPTQPIEKTSTGMTATGVSSVLGTSLKVSGKVTKILEDSEVKNTFSRIESDRPKYRQDGAIFMNRERLLPAKERGYYHEWTVKTLGSTDRGARRIVEGKGGELYFTDDHYESFIRVR